MTNKKGIISIIFGVFISLININFQFILMYLLLHNYGTQFNGFIKISIALLSFLGGVEGGLGSMAVVVLTKSLLQKDWYKANEILYTIKYQYKIGGLIDLLSLFLISIIYSCYIVYTENNFHFLQNNKENIIFPFWKIWIIILTIGTKNLFSLFWSAHYENLIQADQNNYIRRLILIICDLIIYSIIFYLIFLNIDPIYIFLDFWFYSIIKSTLIIIYVKQYYPWISLKTNKQNKNLQLIKSSRIVVFKNIGDTILLNTDIIIIAILFGLKISSIFSLYMTIIVGMRNIMIILINSFKEFFASSMAKNGRIYWNNYIKYETYAFMIGAFLFINQFILSPYLVNTLYARHIMMQFYLWKEYEQKIFQFIFYTPTFALLISLSSMFYIIAEPCNVLIYAKANYKETAKSFFLFGITCLITSFIIAMIALYQKKQYLISLNYILIIICIFSFFRFIYLWIYNWLYLTYNSNCKGILQNWLILLIPIVITILFNYLYMFNKWNPNKIFDLTTLKPLWHWSAIVLIVFATIGISILLIFINSLFWSYKTVLKIFLHLPIIYHIYNKYQIKNNKKYNIIFNNNFIFSNIFKENPYKQEWKREEIINKFIKKNNDLDSSFFATKKIYVLKK